jgi:myo-inositol-1-phosphate synthase
MESGLTGELTGPSAYFMKSPARQFTDYEAREMVEEFIQTAQLVKQ